MAGITLFQIVFHISLVFHYIFATTDLPVVHGNFPVGDPRTCMAVTQGNKLQRFEVLPGGGWDNLRNKDSGLLVSMNYSQCRTTDDGRYLLPDSVHAIPLKSGRVETYAELFDHWRNFTSTTSTSINVEAGLDIGKFGISGKFSTEWEHVKKHMVEDKSVTTRVQVKFVQYMAKLQPDSPLHPSFRKRLMSIAAHIALNRSANAQYESQLLVRDFGTHVITSVDAGAALTQQDQIKSTFNSFYTFDKSKILASASANFLKIAHFSIDTEHTSSKEMIDQYIGNRTHSQILTYGGPMFKPENFSANDWIDDVHDNLVAMDRSGDPIFYLITPYSLPELPLSIVDDLYEQLKSAVEVYYKFNTYNGCTKLDSPNFSFQANVDDGTCHSPLTNYTFGGVYQTCESRQRGAGDLCSGNQQKNPRTGDYSCPNGYDSIPLNQASLSRSQTNRECHSCWLFFKCCDSRTYVSQATYSSFWCAARGMVPQQSGFLFGGVYTSKSGNPLTQSTSCPLHFIPLRLGLDMYVCVSDDYELGYRFSVPFGGFYSCRSGNPLMLSDTKDNLLRADGLQSLGAFLRSSGSEHWPQGCPDGFSQHLAALDQGCEINYCVKAHAFSSMGLPPIERPPFIPAPSRAFNGSEDVMFDVTGQDWKRMTQSSPVNADTQSSDYTSSLSGGAVAGISVVATLLCITIATLAIVRFRRQQRKRTLTMSPFTKSQKGERECLVQADGVHYGARKEESGDEVVNIE